MGSLPQLTYFIFFKVCQALGELSTGPILNARHHGTLGSTSYWRKTYGSRYHRAKLILLAYEDIRLDTAEDEIDK